MKKALLFMLSALSIMLLVQRETCLAEDGVTETLILIGIEEQTGGFSGDEENLGFMLAVKESNDRGGVNGRKLEVKGYAKKGGTASGLENAKRLVEVDKVFCIFNFGSMPLAIALTPYVMEKRVPYLFPHQGSNSLDGKRYIFTSYPFYQNECEVMLRYLTQTRGFKRIGIMYADNEYGYIFRDKLKENSARFGYEVAGLRAVKEQKPTDLTPDVRELKGAAPDALIMALYPEQAKKVLEAKGQLGWKQVTLVSTGPLTDEEYLDVPGGHGEGTIGLCLYPDPDVSQETGVAEYRQAMKRWYPEKRLNRYSLYGYIFGKLTIEGLKRAGKNLTREGFIEAMESIRRWDSGGVIPAVSFSPTKHHAQTVGFIAELKGGKFRPITGWIETE